MGRKNKKIRVLKSLFVFLVFSVISISAISCEDIFFTNDGDIEIKGTWANNGGGGGEDETEYYWIQKLEIENGKISNYFMSSEDEDGFKDWELFWEARIYDYDNDAFNAKEPGQGNCGYAVLKFTKPSVYVPNGKDKFIVLRWRNLRKFNGKVIMEWSEGFKELTEGCEIPAGYADTVEFPENVACGVYYDTIIAAKENVTEGNGFFPKGFSEMERIK